MNEHPDTIPGFTLHSDTFYLEFLTGKHGGLTSTQLEFQTDWFEVMEILLARLEDQPENKEMFETVASRDLEAWAREQPGGDTLSLRIVVTLEERNNLLLAPLGMRKTLVLTFND